VKKADQRPPPEEVLLPEVDAFDVEPVLHCHPDVHVRRPFVPRFHHDVVVPVRARLRHDGCGGDEAELTQEPFRLGEQVRLKALSLLEKQLLPDELLAGRDMQRVHEVVRPRESSLFHRILENGVVVDGKARDHAVAALAHRFLPRDRSFLLPPAGHGKQDAEEKRAEDDPVPRGKGLVRATPAERPLPGASGCAVRRHDLGAGRAAPESVVGASGSRSRGLTRGSGGFDPPFSTR
jgi:hypothetical protein